MTGERNRSTCQKDAETCVASACVGGGQCDDGNETGEDGQTIQDGEDPPTKVVGCVAEDEEDDGAHHVGRDGPELGFCAGVAVYHIRSRSELSWRYRGCRKSECLSGRKDST